jgi:hypothetical protein
MSQLILNPEIIAHYYEALRITPPFDGWNLPHDEEVTFLVFKKPEWYGYYTRWQRHRSGFTIGIGPKVGLVTTLIGTLGHEMIHMHMDLARMDTSVEHNRAFRTLAAEVARLHGFDPMSY